MDKEKIEAILMLFKIFNKKEYAEQFIKGKIYCNTLDFFRKCKDENNDLRNDSLEGYDFISNGNSNSKLIINNDIEIPLTNKCGKNNFKLELNKEYYTKILCMYAITRGKMVGRDNFSIDSKMLAMGDYVVVIEKSNEFMLRIMKKFEENNISYSYKPVQYIDSSNYTGHWDKFKKDEKYKHQKEFRVAFNTNKNGPENLEIGDISDIAKMVTMEEFLNSKIEIKNKENLNENFDEFRIKELVKKD